MPLSFLNLDEFTKHMTPVTTKQLFIRSNEFHPNGLFSELIFGVVGSLDRKKIFSYIDLNCFVVHPSAYKILIQLDRKIEKFLSTEGFFKVEKDGSLVEDENGGVTGINEFIKIFPKIVFRGDTPDREKYIILLKNAYKNKTLFINKLPVIPPDQRQIFIDENGRDIKDPLNDQYEKVLSRVITMKTIGSKGGVYDLFNWSVQQSIIDHDTFIRTKIGKKFGLIRSQLLGKRVDVSGRAVITSGPHLKPNEIGLPFKLAVSLFEQFIMYVLLYSGKIDTRILANEILKHSKLDLSTSSISLVLRSIKGGDVIPKSLYDLIFKATEIAMTGKIVLAKRDPVLHAESVRGFYPVLTNENTIQVSTLEVDGFNADFDGDQMAVFLPITNEAQEEAKKRMIMVRSANSSSSFTFELSKEMGVGLYILSKDKKVFKSPIHITKEDLEKATDPYIPVIYKNQITTMGKAIINSCFPKDFRFIDDLITNKIGNKLIFEVINKYGDEAGKETANRLKDYGFKFSTIFGPSIILDDIIVPEEIYKLKKDLDKMGTEEASKVIEKMVVIMKKHLKDSGLYDLVESGSTKGWDQPTQILIAKGIMSDPTGKILAPIKSSLSDGLTPKEYFSASGGARKGIIDRVLNTATTGYGSRKLAFLLNSVEADLTLKDCKTNLTLDLKLTDDLISRLTGRFIVKGNKVIEFEPSKYKDGNVIHLRTPIFCKSPKICHTCYGKLLALHKSPYIGIISAQNIGERNTQLIMRSFHNTSIKIIKRDFLQDISNNETLLTIEEIKKKLYQHETSLFCSENCVIKITDMDYKFSDLIIDEENNTIYLNNLISTITFNTMSFNLILDYPILLKYANIIKTKEEMEFQFNKDSEIFEVSLEKEDIKEKALYLERLIGGRENFKDVNHLFLKLYHMFKNEKMDLVHFEVLISQAMRDKNNLSYPARLGSDPEHPVLINIKTDVFNSGFLQGLAFENVSKAISTGLISTTELEPSVLEKVLSGNLVEKKERED